MRLANGTRLGPYEILGLIGSGGMGEVYRAADTRLRRTVAVKVSADQFTERFEREARAVAALNHSNICQIYDVGPNYLVMEYIDGQPLKGPLPLDATLRYAEQICDALDAAHSGNVIHRDLKPANILIGKAGIKLLDFGLAKIKPAVSAVATVDATMSMALSANGQIMGTLQYMSPEQLQGRDADARSDIFAFGLVLYELLTGQRAFAGESPASVIAAILERKAPSVANVAPTAVDRVLQRCLVKDPDDRWQSARDLKAALQLAADLATASESAAPVRRVGWRSRLGWLAAAALAVIFLVLIGSWWIRPRPAGELVRFAVLPPDGSVFSGARNTTVPVPQFALSPDGRRLVFAVGPAGGRQMLWVRAMDDPVAHSLPGTEDAIRPFWSPEGSFVGFFAEGALKKIPAGGGHVQVLAENLADPRGGAWGADDTILFGNGSAPLLRVSAAGGPVTAVTELNASHEEIAHRWPQFLPDGVHFLYTVRSRQTPNRGIYAGSLNSKSGKFLVGVDSSGGVYTGSGRLLWADGSSLVGQNFNARSLELSGEPSVLAEQVGRSTTGELALSVSTPSATIAYASAIVQRGRLTWFDRSGNSLGSLWTEGDYPDFRLSPDNRWLALTLVDPKTANPAIWLTDLARGSTSRFTLGTAFNAAPVWSPDGSHLIYRTTRNGLADFYQKSASLGGEEQHVLTPVADGAAGLVSQVATLTDWSSDGRFLIYATPNVSGTQLWVVPNPGTSQPAAKPVRFLNSAANLMHANFSPDGRFVAYSSNETGTYQVYVQTVPVSDRKWPVSTVSGYEPRWRADGHEIYYLTEDRKLMAVEVGLGPSFGTPKPLFQTMAPRGIDPNRTHYVPTRDGQRFLINTQSGESQPNPIIVVLNWTAGPAK